MQEPYLEYILSDEKALLQPERILALLKETAWARHYTLDTIDGIIRNSLCMGAYAGGMQVREALKFGFLMENCRLMFPVRVLLIMH